MSDSKEKPNSKTKPKRKRSLRSFSLRTMMVVVTLLCFLLAWNLNKAARQKRAVQEINEWGINAWESSTIYYDYQMEDNGDGVSTSMGDSSLPASNWLVELFGIDYFAEVVSIKSTSDELDDLSPLADLKKLEYLKLWGTDLRDLSPLVDLKHLETLILANTDVTDLSPLAGLGKLDYLALNKTDVSDLSPLANLKNLRRLDLSRTKVTDLSALHDLKKLEILALCETKVSSEDIERLQQRLPNCRVILYEGYRSWVFPF